MDNELSEDDDRITYYDDNPELPVYYLGKTRVIDVWKVDKILLSTGLPGSQKVATQKPVTVSRNVAFAIDNRYVKDVKDFLSDSMGVWVCTGTKTFYCSFENGRVGTAHVQNYGKQDSVFKIERRFYKTKTAEDVKRNFTVMRSKF